MRVRYGLPFILLVITMTGLIMTGLAMTAPAQSTAAGNASNPPNSSVPSVPSIVGVWRAQADSLPFLTLTFTEEGGKLEGAVLFYLHKRERGGQVTSSPGIPEPLFDLRVEGKRASFAVSHRRAHPPASLSTPPVHFHMDLTDATHATLVNESEPNSGPTEPGNGLPLVRSDY
jgi:hypothetical protein